MSSLLTFLHHPVKDSRISLLASLFNPIAIPPTLLNNSRNFMVLGWREITGSTFTTFFELTGLLSSLIGLLRQAWCLNNRTYLQCLLNRLYLSPWFHTWAAISSCFCLCYPSSWFGWKRDRDLKRPFLCMTLLQRVLSRLVANNLSVPQIWHQLALFYQTLPSLTISDTVGSDVELEVDGTSPGFEVVEAMRNWWLTKWELQSGCEISGC